MLTIESQVVSENGNATHSSKLTYVVLCMLHQYGGRLELSVEDWFSSLRSGLQEPTDSRVVRDLFRQLSADGSIELLSPPPDQGATTTEGDGLCPLQGKFSATVTAKGVSIGRGIMMSSQLRMTGYPFDSATASPGSAGWGSVSARPQDLVVG